MVRRIVCCQYDRCIATITSAAPTTRYRLGREGQRARRSRSPVDVPEDEVEAGQDRDDVRHVDTSGHPWNDRDVVEARRADLDSERSEVALRDDVVAHLAEGILGADPGFAFGNF